MTDANLQQTAVALGLVLARVSSFVVTAPILGRGTVPNTVKAGLCLVLSIFWLPVYTDKLQIGLEVSSGSVVLAIILEMVIGGALGYMVGLIMLPARVAGSYIGQELGFNLGQVADPTSGSATNEAGVLFDAFALVLFWITDAHHMAFRILGLSNAYLHLDRHFPMNLAPSATSIISESHELGIMMVMPMAVIVFVVLIYLAVVMRAWQQVTLFSFGMGARLLIGLGVLLFLMPLILTNMDHVFLLSSQAIEDTFRANP